MYGFSQRSLGVLQTVHPKMQQIAKRAIQVSEVDFGITQGKRTRDQQETLYGQGRTQAMMKAKGLNPMKARPFLKIVTYTMDSNHLSGEAIDVAPYVNGVVEWDEDDSLGLWPKIAAAFQRASSELGIPVAWGGNWKGKKRDRPHFELE